jgi:hypothetical protein
MAGVYRRIDTRLRNNLELRYCVAYQGIETRSEESVMNSTCVICDGPNPTTNPVGARTCSDKCDTELAYQLGHIHDYPEEDTMDTEIISADAATGGPGPVERVITAVLEKHGRPDLAAEIAEAVGPLVFHLGWGTQATMTAIALEGLHDWAEEEDIDRSGLLSKIASRAKTDRRLAAWEQTQVDALARGESS